MKRFDPEIIRRWLTALSLAALLALPLAARAQERQPDTVNPTASSVREEQLLQELNRVRGRVTIPDDRAGTLIQPAGRDWRRFHQGTLPWIGGVAILGMLALLAAFFMWRGRIRSRPDPAGRRILRFNGFERFTHWLTAGSFVVLALTGLNITFGHALLAPLLGAENFAAAAQWGKYAHNFVAFPFMLGVVLMLFAWVRDNIPNRLDMEWLRVGGGLFDDRHPPAPRFNAGQKMVFWVVILGGTAISASGLALLFPFVGTTIAGMQLAQIAHGVIGVLLIAAMLAHIYIGTLGMQGAFDAMGTGDVDLNFAREHHSLWVAKEQAKAKQAPAGGAAAPAE